MQHPVYGYDTVVGLVIRGWRLVRKSVKSGSPKEAAIDASITTTKFLSHEETIYVLDHAA